MIAESAIAAADMVVLAGGLGSRLQGVLEPGLPKCLAQVAGRPFLFHLLDSVYRAGVRRVHLALGYGAGAVIAALDDFRLPADLRLGHAVEPQPLGTGGAIRFALPQLHGDTVLAMNGDTLSDVGLKALLEFHRARQAKITVGLVWVDDARRYGRVEMAADGAIVRFTEKDAGAGGGFVNAGVYAIDRRVISAITPHRPVSFERDVMPQYCNAGLNGLGGATRLFIDIGTPESLAAATHAVAGAHSGERGNRP